MKKLIYPILLACISLGLQACHDGSRTIRGMYVMEPRITGPDEITACNLGGYDFFYLVITPWWDASDFRSPADSLVKVYVDGFSSGRPDIIRKFISTAHSQGAKVLLCLQGEDFIRIASDRNMRENFTAMATTFVSRYGFDGIDLDWELTVTPELHLEMMLELRNGLDSLDTHGGHHYLTTALNCGHRYTEELAAGLSDAADWINLMYYDMGGGLWGTSASHNSPLDAIKKNYNESWSIFDPAKIHIGLASYGYGYLGLSPGEETPEGKTLADYIMPSWCVPEGWVESWDENAHVPYYFSPDGTSFMTAENSRSLKEKAEWIKESGFGGFFWWEFHCDWDPVTGRHTLSDTIADDFKR